jgi:hypothetical protein
MIEFIIVFFLVMIGVPIIVYFTVKLAVFAFYRAKFLANKKEKENADEPT